MGVCPGALKGPSGLFARLPSLTAFKDASVLGSEIDAVSAVSDFGAPTEKWFPWTRVYQWDEWLSQLVSRSDHGALEPAVRDRLFEAIGSAIDDQGGSFVTNFETVLITATRLG